MLMQWMRKELRRPCSKPPGRFGGLGTTIERSPITIINSTTLTRPHVLGMGIQIFTYAYFTGVLQFHETSTVHSIDFKSTILVYSIIKLTHKSNKSKGSKYMHMYRKQD